MTIGINVTAAFIEPRTGVEEYTYQLIKHLTMLKESEKHRFILYSSFNKKFDFHLPDNFEIKRLKWGFPAWTQIRLSIEMAINSPDVLFIPVHTLPLIHPKKSVVTIHGLEYEYEPEMYPTRHLKYLRWSTKYALKNAKKIIAISENTKNDLIKIYRANPEKISVVHHGVSYLPHKLILAGGRGYGYDTFAGEIERNKDIIEMGYVSEEEKWHLLKNAALFAFPVFYEGFGMPILEAQAMGCPIITSKTSSLPEVAGEGVALIEPKNIEKTVEMMYKVMSDEELRNSLIEKGYQNIKRFSWEKCARETLGVLIDNK